MRKIALPLLVASILMASCRTQKVERTEVRQSDTLIVKKETIKAPNLNHTLTVHDICDSITGEVVKFRDVFVIDGDSVKVWTDENNTLRREIKARERIISEKDSEVSRIKEQLSDVKEMVRYKVPWDWAIGLLVAGFAVRHFRPWRYLL